MTNCTTHRASSPLRWLDDTASPHGRLTSMTSSLSLRKIRGQRQNVHLRRRISISELYQVQKSTEDDRRPQLMTFSHIWTSRLSLQCISHLGLVARRMNRKKIRSVGMIIRVDGVYFAPPTVSTDLPRDLRQSSSHICGRHLSERSPLYTHKKHTDKDCTSKLARFVRQTQSVHVQSAIGTTLCAAIRFVCRRSRFGIMLLWKSRPLWFRRLPN